MFYIKIYVLYLFHDLQTCLTFWALPLVRNPKTKTYPHPIAVGSIGLCESEHLAIFS